MDHLKNVHTYQCILPLHCSCNTFFPTFSFYIVREKKCCNFQILSHIWFSFSKLKIKMSNKSVDGYRLNWFDVCKYSCKPKKKFISLVAFIWIFNIKPMSHNNVLWQYCKKKAECSAHCIVIISLKISCEYFAICIRIETF